MLINQFVVNIIIHSNLFVYEYIAEKYADILIFKRYSYGIIILAILFWSDSNNSFKCSNKM